MAEICKLCKILRQEVIDVKVGHCTICTTKMTNEHPYDLPCHRHWEKNKWVCYNKQRFCNYNDGNDACSAKVADGDTPIEESAIGNWETNGHAVFDDIEDPRTLSS